ncbi:MAG TPA: Calx-beta domain-containing protein, partial [Usitatibacter sp.]|nr:Calx-beta domain-containing protein [Usitatibacter sp.]
AVAGQDFGTKNVATLPTGIAAFAIGESIKTINLPILQDTVVEGPETFSINLSQPSPGMLLVAPVTASITILDDDIPPESSVAFTQTKIVVLEGAPFAGASIERTAITSLDRPLTVKYATQAGTALAGSDFSTRTGTLTWAAGEGGVKGIRSFLPLDTVPESPETFKFVLTDVSAGGRIDTPSATVVILDDDEKFPPYGAVPEGWIVPVDASRGWHVSNEPGNYEGVFSLRSDFIDDGQTAQMEVARVFTAGNITFRLRVSSEAGFDKLRFLVDGVEQRSWSGTSPSGWQVFSVPITAGAHTLRWSYEKDEAISVGQDAAWIDAVSLP